MSRFANIYCVPGWARLLAAVAALATAASLPLLGASASKMQLLLVVGAGLFSASVAVFGRQASTDRARARRA